MMMEHHLFNEEIIRLTVALNEANKKINELEEELLRVRGPVSPDIYRPWEILPHHHTDPYSALDAWENDPLDNFQNRDDEIDYDDQEFFPSQNPNNNNNNNNNDYSGGNQENIEPTQIVFSQNPNNNNNNGGGFYNYYCGKKIK